MLSYISLRLAWLCSGTCLLVPGSQLTAPAQAGSIVIRKGGVYTGDYRSTDSTVPCIRIVTTEPVTLRGCRLSGAGNLIEALNGGADLTVENCTGVGLRPSRDQTRRGRFLEINSARNLRLLNNSFTQTTGIAVYQWSGDGSASQTLKILRNSAKNIDGRYRDGGSTTVSCISLNQVHGLANVEIAWNQIVNEPDQSLVEDNINLYNSSGTASSPIRVHNNYVQGAYPYPATAAKFTGTGMITDGDNASALTMTAYVDATQNQFVSTCNSAMNIAGGHHVRYTQNRMVTSGLLPNGTKLNATYCGIAVFNFYQQAQFGNHLVDNNTMGMVKWGANNPYPNRNDNGDYGFPIHTNTQHLPNPITLQTEQDEWTRWNNKLKINGVQVGPTAALSLSTARSDNR
ncbi:hypothetical protein [Hymenobacter cellulosilyticus]|uniref:Right-handed parallel beta-helix repeat-containing protein n=1 Tax=Hymenobacter cellulosilyticus TaxID=2932248 RepID=A0A8T9Q3K3_9BACT|nr:hypothetical protein [Hymenobacter cellulosilyticus]UOQ70029.1 hypothetical protein MUN79_14680 [Hymenobacter cellulosilyticus]